jgi:hypothetical protein
VDSNTGADVPEANSQLIESTFGADEVREISDSKFEIRFENLRIQISKLRCWI